jgi:hypothetical protein
MKLIYILSSSLLVIISCASYAASNMSQANCRQAKHYMAQLVDEKKAKKTGSGAWLTDAKIFAYGAEGAYYVGEALLIFAETGAEVSTDSANQTSQETNHSVAVKLSNKCLQAGTFP